MPNPPSPGHDFTRVANPGTSTRPRIPCRAALWGLAALALAGCHTAADRASDPAASSFTMQPVFAAGHAAVRGDDSAARGVTAPACAATSCEEPACGQSVCDQSACGGSVWGESIRGDSAGIPSDLVGPRTPGAIFRDDAGDFLPRLRDDSLGLVSWHNAALLAAAGGMAIGMRQGLDDDVREAVAEHPQRWGTGTKVLGHIGEAQYHIAAIGAFYGYTLFADDPELHDYSTAMVSAFTLTAVGTSIIKVAANTDRPSDEWNDGKFGFPSYHVASLASIAAVTEEYHGLAAAAPLYVLTGLVGWSRIDERDHDLSDVAFGAALGWVIGKSVAASRLHGDGRVRLSPYFHPQGGSGLAFEVPF
jgi:hypothetical protein